LEHRFSFHVTLFLRSAGRGIVINLHISAYLSELQMKLMIQDSRFKNLFIVTG